MTSKVKPTDLLRLYSNGVKPAGRVALDTETSGLHVDDGARVAVVSLAWEHSPEWDEHLENHDGIVSVAFPFDQGTQGTGKPEDDGQASFFEDDVNLPLEEWVALLEWLEKLARDKGRYLVMHHAKFDMHMMAVGCRPWDDIGVYLDEALLWDTQNVCHLAWPFHRTSLKPTAKRIWGIAETDESEIVQQYLRKAKLPAGRWDLVPWDIIAPYAEQDARLTIRLYLHQYGLLQEGQLVDWMPEEEATWLIDRRLEVTKMLFNMERRGLPFNAPKALETGKVIDRLVADLEAKLPFQPPTLPMAKHYWFGEGIKNGVKGLKLTPYGYTQSGQAQVNAQVVEKMADDGVPHADIWRDLQKLQTVGSRWYHGWGNLAGKDGRLRASVRQNGTVSGRFSVERVQLQAIPHDYRLTGDILKNIPTPRKLIAEGVPEGQELWELDLAQAELRVAALYANCERMLALIHKGDDLHGDAAQQLFDITPDDPQWGEMRNVAKRANFSLIFGVGADKLRGDIEAQTGIVLSYEDTKQLVYDWNALYPEYRQAIEMHQNIIERRQRKEGHGWIQLWNNERRWFTAEEEAHKAFNQRVQPALAQFGLDWWLKTDRIVEGKGELVMTVHDSIVLLLDSATASETATAVQDAGLQLWDEVFPGVPGGVDMKRWD